MSFLESLFKNNPTDIFLKFTLIIIVINIIIISISYYYDYINKKNLLKRIEQFETSLKDLVEEFRSFELLLTNQKKTLEEYKYNFLRTEQEISRLADSHSNEKNLTQAISLAKEGLGAEEISRKTNLPIEDIEPIIKYHGKS